MEQCYQNADFSIFLLFYFVFVTLAFCFKYWPSLLSSFYHQTTTEKIFRELPPLFLIHSFGYIISGLSSEKKDRGYCFNLRKFALLHLANFSIHLTSSGNLGNIKLKKLLITSHKKSQQTQGLQKQFWSGRAKKYGQDKLALGVTVLLFIMHLHTIIFILES